MNPDEMRRIFDTVLTSPPPSSVDIDAAVRAGRRGRRRRPLAVAASVAVVLAAAGIAVAAMQHDSTPQPAATVADMDAIQMLAADAGVPVTSASALFGVWQTVQIDGKDVSEVRDRNGDPLFARFGENGAPWWSANDGCNEHSGWLTVTSDGGFAAAPGGTTLVACIDTDQYPRNPESVLAAQEARIFGAEDEPRHLMLVSDGRILAVYIYQPDADLGSRGQR